MLLFPYLPFFLKPDPIAEKIGVSWTILHGARSTPGPTALSFSSSHIAHLSAFSCLFKVDSKHIIFFFWSNVSIFNQEFFTFHLFKVVSFGIFCSILKIWHVFDQSLTKIKNCKWYIFFHTIKTLSFFFLLMEGHNSWGKNKEKKY